MSQTKAQRKKEQRRLARRGNVQKASNLRKALFPERYRLDVLIEGEWRSGVKYFRKMSAVEAHRDKTEQQRIAGEDIVAGRVVDLQTGKLIVEIAGSTPPPVKGSLPDTLADKPESAKKGLFERAKELVKSVE